MRSKMSSAIFPPNCVGQNVLITSGSTCLSFLAENGWGKWGKSAPCMGGQTCIISKAGLVVYTSVSCCCFSELHHYALNTNDTICVKIYISTCVNNYLQFTKWIMSFLFLSDNICMKMRHGTHILFEQEKKIGIRCLFVIAIKVLP